MRLDEVQEELDNIKLTADDPEEAHACEKALYRQFIRSVSEHDLGDLSKAAALVLTSSDIDFPRWFA